MQNTCKPIVFGKRNVFFIFCTKLNKTFTIINYHYEWKRTVPYVLNTEGEKTN